MTMLNRGYLANNSKDNCIAVIGSGESARVFVEWSQVKQFDVFTTLGEGCFLGNDVKAIETLVAPEAYQQVIIANQYVDEILERWIRDGKCLDNVYWFDFMNLKLGNIDAMSYRQMSKESSLFVVYDLSVLPATFDIATFLVRAELRRLALKLDNIALIILGGSFGGLSARANLSHGEEQGHWRIQHVLIPMSQMLPSCESVSFVRTKKQLKAMTDGEQTFPNDLSMRADFNLYALAPLQKESERGNDIRALRAPFQAKHYAKQFLDSRDIKGSFITISLREYTHQASRNTCLDSYLAVAEKAKAMGLSVVLIRDTNMALEKSLGWGDVIECPVASFDIAVRMAIYEAAFLNVSVSSGPSCGLMLLSKHCDFLLTHLIDNNQMVSHEEFLAKRQGILTGQQFSFSSEYQRICWRNDEDGMTQEFENLIERKRLALSKKSI